VSIFINQDGSVEAWDGDNYVPMGSMRTPEPVPEIARVIPEPPRLYIVIEEYPAFTIDEFLKLARDQRQQRTRSRRFRRLLQEAADLAARGFGGDS
jgi:hypothetical protein